MKALVFEESSSSLSELSSQISADKKLRPIELSGASKLLFELLLNAICVFVKLLFFVVEFVEESKPPLINNILKINARHMMTAVFIFKTFNMG